MQNFLQMQSTLDFPLSQLSDSCLERKLKMRRLEIWAFKIVSISLSFLNEITYCPPERLALKWVQTYIKEFGGDPEKVTM
jgi:Carboxylesterase family